MLLVQVYTYYEDVKVFFHEGNLVAIFGSPFGAKFGIERDCT
jgi:hypothetical protein